uniref:Hemerythrin-like domain-containing protein n=1 Tax=Timspurckia oligopyrenoides TaxID=708627 RepID=A0A7S0ZER0_9RHOD|mmetsp:Transcript_2395/g.4194  ORF Transcript_2395/g.4194 Transcript_2395/m.4194 type:complete len:760 (+) Transcript_2395:53-2332(+)
MMKMSDGLEVIDVVRKNNRFTCVDRISGIMNLEMNESSSGRTGGSVEENVNQKEWSNRGHANVKVRKSDVEKGMKENTGVLREFAWEPCGSVIKMGLDDEADLVCCAHWDARLKFKVHMDSEFTWNVEKDEWRWLKTWKLPQISVSTEIGTAEEITELQTSKWILRLMIVASEPQGRDFDLIQVLSNDKFSNAIPYLETRPGFNDEAVFPRAWLTSTSNAFGGRRFHFLVNLLTELNVNGSIRITSIASLISSAFSVYSRKDSDYRQKPKADGSRTRMAVPRRGSTEAVLKEKPSTDVFNIFKPELFTKPFVKKVCVHEDGEQKTREEIIDDSWVGLERYLQASNIRFKSRNPILLAYRFCSVLVLKFDSAFFENHLRTHRDSLSSTDDTAIRNLLMNSLLCATGFGQFCTYKHCPACKILRGSGELSGEKEHQRASDVGNMLWCLAFKSSCDVPVEQRQWLIEHLQFVRSFALGFVEDERILPASFKSFDSMEELRSKYCQVYKFVAALQNTVEHDEKPLRQQDKPDSIAPIEAKQILANARDRNFKQDSRWSTYHSILYQRHERLLNDMNLSVQMNPAGHIPEQSRRIFDSYFFGLHNRIRRLLKALTDAASYFVAGPDDRTKIRNLFNAFQAFSEELAVHSYVEDTILFPALEKRIPGVTESYSFDHAKESGHLSEIGSAICSSAMTNAAELFLGVSSFAALHMNHMEKEEQHLAPYFGTHFSGQEVVKLIQLSELASRDAQFVRSGKRTIDMIQQ